MKETKNYLITYRADYVDYHDHLTEVTSDLEDTILGLRTNSRCDCTILCIQEISDHLYFKLKDV